MSHRSRVLQKDSNSVEDQRDPTRGACYRSRGSCALVDAADKTPPQGVDSGAWGQLPWRHGSLT